MTKISKIGFSLAGALCLSSAALLIFYGASGSYVAEDGLLVEEFWALALGSFGLIGAIFVTLVTGAVSLVRRIIRKTH